MGFSKMKEVLRVGTSFDRNQSVMDQGVTKGRPSATALSPSLSTILMYHSSQDPGSHCNLVNESAGRDHQSFGGCLPRLRGCCAVRLDTGK
ncbi:hypothetical protein BaRGS_00011559 [Batillaria attramentaria]|uniref:Uncharacterized protein n=1 Tax=Batillaria attramentaria TaxID=370345 RepID=A0ABD0LD10_9CAEN